MEQLEQIKIQIEEIKKMKVRENNKNYKILFIYFLFAIL